MRKYLKNARFGGCVSKCAHCILVKTHGIIFFKYTRATLNISKALKKFEPRGDAQIVLRSTYRELFECSTFWFKHRDWLPE